MKNIPKSMYIFMKGTVNMEKLFTVDNIAEMTGLTSRTIRNYIADGRLKGRKIGSQWRFTEGDIEAMFSSSEAPAAGATRTAEVGINDADIDSANGKVCYFLKPKRRDNIAVCTVVDYPAESENAPAAVVQLIELAAAEYDEDELTYTYEYLADVKIGRFTFIGDIEPIAKLIKLIRKKG